MEGSGPGSSQQVELLEAGEEAERRGDRGAARGSELGTAEHIYIYIYIYYMYIYI